MGRRRSGGEPAKPRRRRDEGGRFIGRRPSRRRVGTSRAGCRGPSHLASKSHHDLVAIRTVVQHRLGRLEAECEGREWRDPEAVLRPNMHAVVRKRDALKRKRVRAIEAAVKHFARQRVNPEFTALHEQVEKELGGPIPVRALYRKPYVSVWNPGLSRKEGPAHRSPLGKANAELARRSLIGFILRDERRIEERRTERRIALVAESNAEGWEPLPKR